AGPRIKSGVTMISAARKPESRVKLRSYRGVPHDRPVADPDRARLAARPVAHPAADVPRRAVVQRLCDRRAETPWCDQGWLAGDKAAIALPPLGRTRLRPGAMRQAFPDIC